MNDTETKPDVLAEIAAERTKQIAKGFDAAHDDEHASGEIALAAAALCGSVTHENKGLELAFRAWPWEPGTLAELMMKPKRAQLIVAAALVLAEIERLDRKGGNHVA